MATTPVTPRIVFYAWDHVEGEPEFNLRAAAASVSRLAGEAYLFEDGDMTTAAIVDRPGRGQSPTCLRFLRLRRDDNLPHIIEPDRTTVPVTLLADQALAEWTHVVIWPDGYLAHDPRRDAPTLSRLRRYLRVQAGEHVQFISLFDRDLIGRLRRLQDLRSLEIKIITSEVAQGLADRNRGLIGGLLALGRDAESATLSTTLSVGRERRRSLDPSIRTEAIELAESALDSFETFIVKGRDADSGKVVTLDLLSERVEVESRGVARISPGVRTPEAEPMYNAIISARSDLDDDNRLGRASRSA